MPVRQSQKHQKISEFKKSVKPISYSSISINSQCKLEERKNKLKERIVEGYGVIWKSINDRDERFVKGCFAKSISEIGPESNSAYKIKFRDRHGKSVSLFAELKEDEIGLYFKTVPLDKVPWADDLLTQIESGTINNFSIGFLHCWDKVEWDDEDDCLINLEAKLIEISAVDIPSDTGTYAIRSAEESEVFQERIEEFVNSLQKSKQLEARKIITECLSLTDIEPQIQKRKDALKSKSKPKSKTKINLRKLADMIQD